MLKQRLGKGFIIACLPILSVLMLMNNASACPKALPILNKEIIGKRVFFHVIIPSDYRIETVYSPKLQTLKSFVDKHQPQIAINGGFFDPKNGKTISHIQVRNDQNKLDWINPRDNQRLTENKSLKPYLEKIFNRSEFRKYQCKNENKYDIVSHKAGSPNGCELIFALGAGPELFPKQIEASAKAEGFIDHNNKGQISRDPIGINRFYARSALGITANGEIILGMGGVNPVIKSSITKTFKPVGFSLSEIKDLMLKAGAVKVLALDGGGSSGLYHDGHFLYGKYTKEGLPEKRRLKSVLLIFNPE